ncbi:MAG: ribosomal protein S18-alanine N-acetyltransferase [Deltaproteobacteria bacterium]|nr:ribosomal protein S18-alanine N-acetyltransferase [Deltaproteobacteria bacterium]
MHANNKKVTDIIIEPMSEDDLDGVMEIEEVSFPKCWPRDLMARELMNPVSYPFVMHGTVDDKKQVVGYIVIWIVHGDAHILDLAVAPALRGGGLAKRLISFALRFMVERGTVVVSLEVRRSNEAAIKIYRSFGFNQVYVRDKYYGDEDAIVMSLALTEGLNEEK